MSRGKPYKNKTKYRSAKYAIKEEKLVILRHLAQEMIKNTNMTNKEAGVDEIDNYLSAAVATENDIE